MRDDRRVDNMVVPFDIFLGCRKGSKVFRSGAVYFLLALPFVRFLRRGSPEHQEIVRGLVIDRLRRPDAAGLRHADRHRPRRRPIDEIGRFPYDDLAAALIHRGLPAFAARDAKIRRDQIKLVRLRRTNEKRIPHALLPQLGTQHGQAFI